MHQQGRKNLWVDKAACLAHLHALSTLESTGKATWQASGDYWRKFEARCMFSVRCALN